MSEGPEAGDADHLFEREDQAYGLENRTFVFAKEVQVFARTLPRTLSNYEDVKQLIRSSGSVGANFIEAVESLSRKDYVHRIKICRKEAKESRYWLRLLHIELEAQENSRQSLIKEAHELMLILSAIIAKCEK